MERDIPSNKVGTFGRRDALRDRNLFRRGRNGFLARLQHGLRGHDKLRLQRQVWIDLRHHAGGAQDEDDDAYPAVHHYAGLRRDPDLNAQVLRRFP